MQSIRSIPSTPRSKVRVKTVRFATRSTTRLPAHDALHLDEESQSSFRRRDRSDAGNPTGLNQCRYRLVAPFMPPLHSRYAIHRFDSACGTICHPGRGLEFDCSVRSKRGAFHVRRFDDRFRGDPHRSLPQAGDATRRAGRAGNDAGAYSAAEVRGLRFRSRKRRLLGLPMVVHKPKLCSRQRMQL